MPLAAGLSPRSQQKKNASRSDRMNGSAAADAANAIIQPVPRADAAHG